ncbi:MAG: hypothetical protein HY260_14810 [Chloroflexi bacterium]|nr:hypothetical protein [Chloroflexota bacterium]
MPSKLCPHSLVPTSDARAWVQAGCPLVKLVNDFGPANEYLSINPRLIVTGRGYTDLTLLEQYQSGDPPEEAARKFVVEQSARYYSRNPQVKIWEGHNEPSFGGPDDPGAVAKMSWYGHYEAERLNLLEQMGLRGVVGNFSTVYPEIGANELRMWNAFMPAIEAAKRHRGFLGLHEYAAPWLWWYAGDYQKSNCPGQGNPAFPGGFLGDMGWLTLRYRQVYRYALAPRGLGDVPLVITECGNDKAGGGCPEMPAAPWRELTNYWGSWDGSTDPIDYWRTAGDNRDPERYYAEQFIWYDRELQKDPFVAGATVFTFGSNDPTWDPFNVAGTRFAAYLAEYIRRTQSEPAVTTAAPTTTPVVSVPAVSGDAGAATTTDADFATPPDGGTATAADSGVEVAGRVAVSPASAVSATSRGLPRVQYARVYLLMPAGLTDPTWVSAAAVAIFSKRRVTIGGSADDAGVGNLNSRTVIAVNPETWGATPPLHDWFAQNYPGAIFTSIHATSPGDLVRILLTTAPPKPAPPPATAPMPPVGQPRAQYPRTHVLISPKMTDPNWAASVANSTWSHRYTIGGSADDGGIGDLDSRRVIALNPDDWGGDLEAWYAENYPGVEYYGVRAASPADVPRLLAPFLK